MTIERTLARRGRRSVAVAGMLALLMLLTGARHQVRPRETYGSVAADFGVPEDAVRRANPGKQTLAPGDIITVPERDPPLHAWSSSHPYAPPVPTVAELQRGIRNGNVRLTENPDHRGYYFMWAGTNLDVEIGQIHPRRVKNRRVHDFYLSPETGGFQPSIPGTLESIGRTRSFRRPPVVDNCTCVPAGK